MPKTDVEEAIKQMVATGISTGAIDPSLAATMRLGGVDPEMFRKQEPQMDPAVAAQMMEQRREAELQRAGQEQDAVGQALDREADREDAAADRRLKLMIERDKIEAAREKGMIDAVFRGTPGSGASASGPRRAGADGGP